MEGYVSSIESLGLVDGPGIRNVVFLGGCKLRCKYCQNPEMWHGAKPNITAEELANKIIRNKPYFGNNGGVTFSGGEPLLQSKFLIEVCKILKKENIHIALDTAGVGNGDYKELLSYVDLVLLDVKHTNPKGYQDLTGLKIDESLNFIKALNERSCPVWIRQVIVPGLHDNDEYLDSLLEFLKQIKNIERIDFLPYHKLGDEKYVKLGITNPFKEKLAMDKEKCTKLYNEFMTKYNKKNEPRD
ncbi:MAG: pyruvate formate lyase-activating protein [Bacilli bacterium]|nr:pyruvate formate lyase-activating protein [Bacilli bacterium]